MVYDYVSSRLLKWEKQRSELPFSLQETKCAVSVIMATYNRPETIAEAIQSVLSQSFQDYELIIINDGGSSETDEIVRGFDSTRIIYVRTRHQGVSAARNEGLSRAHGTYITYLDDDDVFYPNHLDYLVKMAQKVVSPFVCSKVSAVLGERRGGEFVGLNELWRNSEFSLERLRISPIIPNLSVLHTKQSLEEIGGFNEELAQCEDWDVWARYARRFPITRGNDITGEYRIATINTTRQRPERTEFYTRLMGYYLGSERGLAILTVAAYELGEKKDCESWIKILSEECAYLSNEQLARIIEVALGVNSEASRRLLSRALELQPAVFIKTWTKCLTSRRLPALLTQISFKDYSDMTMFVVRNRKYCASRALFRIRQRLRGTGPAEA
jgi:glycosyltransferase involved in cell wall biosynthesis